MILFEDPERRVSLDGFDESRLDLDLPLPFLPFSVGGSINQNTLIPKLEGDFSRSWRKERLKLSSSVPSSHFHSFSKSSEFGSSTTIIDSTRPYVRPRRIPLCRFSSRGFSTEEAADLSCVEAEEAKLTCVLLLSLAFSTPRSRIPSSAGVKLLYCTMLDLGRSEVLVGGGDFSYSTHGELHFPSSLSLVVARPPFCSSECISASKSNERLRLTIVSSRFHGLEQSGSSSIRKGGREENASDSTSSDPSVPRA